jgi:ElaA protein
MRSIREQVTVRQESVDEPREGGMADCDQSAERRACESGHPCRGSCQRLEWKFAPFEGLTTSELYAVLGLRQAVFVVEQAVPYRDIDDRDQTATHLLCWWEGSLCGYLRILPKDVFEKGCYSFGRVVVDPNARRVGLGRALVGKALAHLDDSGDACVIKISSQLYLKEFYESFGFRAVGRPYIEDLLPHIAMIRQ